MIFKVLTLFPELFEPFSSWSIIGRARESGLLDIEIANIRDYSLNKHRKVDDYSYGGGPGMVMSCEPIVRCLEDFNINNSKVIYLSPKGKVFNQREAERLSKEKEIVLLCGHYEGIDERVIENYVDEEISLGDYVLTGGELASMIVIEAVSRLIPGVLSSEDSYTLESHYNYLLEYPQYTRPSDFRGLRVPDVLLNGNHKEIDEWRFNKAVEYTKKRRPDLWELYKKNSGKED